LPPPLQVLVAMLKMDGGGAVGDAGTIVPDPPSQVRVCVLTSMCVRVCLCF
jgi:hypothetical protein